MFYNSGEFDADNPSILFQDEGKTQLKKQFRNYINDFNEDDFFLVGNNEYIQGENNPLKAAKFLLNKKQGVVKNAFKNTPYGDIGIPYGDTEHGLYHIINKHILELDDFDSLTEVINTINDVLRNGTKKQINNKTGRNKITIEKDGFLLLLAQSKNGDFVLTSYDTTRNENSKKKKLPTLHSLTKALLRKMEPLYFQKPTLRIILKILTCQVFYFKKHIMEAHIILNAFLLVQSVQVKVTNPLAGGYTVVSPPENRRLF